MNIFIYLLKCQAVLCKCILLSYFAVISNAGSFTEDSLLDNISIRFGDIAVTSPKTQDRLKQTRWGWFLVTGNPPKPVQKLPLTNHLFSMMGSFLWFVAFRSSVSQHLGWWARSLGRAHAGTPWFGPPDWKKMKTSSNLRIFGPHKVNNTYKHAKKKWSLHTSFNVVGGII